MKSAQWKAAPRRQHSEVQANPTRSGIFNNSMRSIGKGIWPKDHCSSQLCCSETCQGSFKESPRPVHRLRGRRSKEAKFLLRERPSKGPGDPEDLVMLMISPWIVHRE